MLIQKIKQRSVTWWEAKGDFVIVYSGFTFFVILYFSTAFAVLNIKREKNPEPTIAHFEEQMRHLDTVQESLKNLSAFVDSQKDKINKSESLLRSLNDEEQRLKPLIEADRKALETIFQVQEQRARASANAERAIAFGLGVLSSIVASFFMHVITRRRL